jgi:hypothetical protein
MKRLVSLLLSAALGACSTPRLDVPRSPSQAWPHPEQTALGRDFAAQLPAPGEQSGFHLLVSGMEAFATRAALAERAQHTLDLQYYILSEDTTTQLLLYRVLRAAERGVRVRLLIDDLYALGKDFDLATFSAQPNIEVRVFNPFLSRGGLGLSQVLEFLGDAARLNRRMHNKLWIADNAAAVAGGRNLGDEYFEARDENNFADLDVLAAGPVVQDISRSFDEYWNSAWAVPIEAFVPTPPGPERVAEFKRAWEARLESFRDSDYARALRETGPGLALRTGQLALTRARAEVVYDKPPNSKGRAADQSPRAIYSRLRPVVEAARQGGRPDLALLHSQRTGDRGAQRPRAAQRASARTHQFARVDRLFSSCALGLRALAQAAARRRHRAARDASRAARRHALPAARRVARLPAHESRRHRPAAGDSRLDEPRSALAPAKHRSRSLPGKSRARRAPRRPARCRRATGTRIPRDAGNGRTGSNARMDDRTGR